MSFQGKDGEAERTSRVLRALEYPERRRILYALLEHNPQAALVGSETIHVGETEIGTLNLELQHQHLPMLEDQGLISWDQEANQLHKGPAFEQARELIVAVKEQDTAELHP